MLNPFIAHLKAAQDQIAQGGYSVLLAPEAGSNATWFTKGTVERFVLLFFLHWSIDFPFFLGDISEVVVILILEKVIQLFWCKYKAIA